MSTSPSLSTAPGGYDPDAPVLLITGCSTGFGHALAERALARGLRVAVTARRLESVRELCDHYPQQALPLAMDVTRPHEVVTGIAAAIDTFGQLDVVVNNAGYGLIGSVEEVSDEQIRAQFETNVFGVLAVTRAALPHLRRQGSGHIVQISSVAGQGTMPALGLYCASKWALEAFSEALAAEVAPLGIRVTIVEPGAFRTDFGIRSLVAAEPIRDYDATAGVVRRRFASMDPAGLGDPGMGAELILDVVQSPEPPLRLPLGADSVAQIRAALAGRQEELEHWAEAGTSLTLAGAS